MRSVPNLAYGKVILVGEHAVVYGIPAIALGIERGVRAWLSPSTFSCSELVIKEWGVHVCNHEQEESDIGRAFRSLLKAGGNAERWGKVSGVDTVRVEVESDLSPGVGLGCSAALGVAIARALDPKATAEAVIERAMQWEKVFHGSPSGIDTTIAAHGGCIFFKKGKGMVRIKSRLKFLLCVAYSGSASSTRVMVEQVAQLLENHRPHVEALFNRIRRIVSLTRKALESEEYQKVGDLMDDNQACLDSLSLSTPALGQLCQLAKRAGAWGAKLTGAGGGGCVIALVGGEEVAERVIQSWKEHGYSGFIVRNGIRDQLFPRQATG
ncbi:mevalonate kinase [Pajaroellobacter abortibovis]|uniref:Mevalonate kinase n=1 Tax=Pajaroellobacter abortibovis TaxID=1882918 RepID=A0A1L6MXT8_9BACT|nr:mevalonate kinase [Pajaroellobacter abortibovis]APS00320.1 mevalonate kinase [Pajaroellobacter abortibovis]